MYDYGDFHSGPRQTIWHTLNRLLIVLIAFTVIVLIACAFVPELRNARGESDRVDELRAQLDKKRTLLSEDMRKVELLKTDPEYVETVARDRLDLMKKDETIYRIGPPPAPDTSNMHLNKQP